MERLSEEHFKLSSLRIEHYHRYSLAARVARGNVVDCACGIGYGSKFFNHAAVKSYQGIDPDVESIEYARKHFDNGKINFRSAQLENIPLDNNSVDTFVTLETLEHLEDVGKGLAEIKRVTKTEGIVLGSVPSAFLEGESENLYGINPYHIQRFSEHELRENLHNFFESVHIFEVALELGSVFKPINRRDTTVPVYSMDACGEQGQSLGSYFFVCGSEDAVSDALGKLPPSPCFLRGISKIQLDKEERVPLLQLCEERWQLLQKTEQMVLERDKIIADHNQSLTFKLQAVVKRLKRLVCNSILY